MSSNQLKQYCMSQELTLVYEVTEIIGPPNNRKFVMSCKVKNYATQGINVLTLFCQEDYITV